MLHTLTKTGSLERLREIDREKAVSYFSIFIVWLFVLSALIGMGLGHVDWFITKTPLNLLLGFTLLILNVSLHSKKAILMLISAFVIGMLVEAAGVATGAIFGEYYYGNNLGIKYLGVPVIIGIYWAVLTIASSMIARKWFKNIWVVSLIGASLMVGLDVVMETMASRFDFWHFMGGHPPAANYIAWFVLGFFLNLLSYENVEKSGENFSLHLWLSQFTFFGISFIMFS